jgi:hypothetical protein
VASSTGLPRSNGGVWEVADVEESRWVKGGVMERSAATGNVDVLTRSGARPCTIWRARACLGAYGAVGVVVLSDVGEHGQLAMLDSTRERMSKWCVMPCTA